MLEKVRTRLEWLYFQYALGTGISLLDPAEVWIFNLITLCKEYKNACKLFKNVF